MNTRQEPVASIYHPKVFISYSHDSFEHINRVLKLSNHLRDDGVDCNLDQYEISPPRGWADWTERQIEEADFVIVVGTETYEKRFIAEELPGRGLGVAWEAAVIKKNLYEAGAANEKFIPVVFSSSDGQYIPSILGTYTYHNLDSEEGYARLYRQLTNQPSIIKPGLGQLRAMAPLERTPSFFMSLEREEDGRTELPGDLQLILATQQRTVEEHSNRFVGRENVLRAFDRFMDRHTRGYFVLRGGPGQGKTAISSFLVKNYGCIYHFISSTGRRSDTRLILRSLLGQMIKLSQIKTTIYDSIPALVSTLSDLLGGQATTNQKLILVIDALDELAEDAESNFQFLLTDLLPNRVFIFVTSRPGRHLDELEEQLSASPYEIHDLGALQIAEARSAVQLSNPELSEGQVTRIVEASQGNPLFMHSLTGEVGRNPGFDVNELPSSLEAFFRRTTKDLRNNQTLLLMLGVLAAVRKPLTLPEMSGILGQSQREIYERGVDAVRPFLLEVDGSYRLYHARFQDYVIRELLYDDELRNCHRLIANWLEGPKNAQSDYRLSSRAYHLFQAGERRELQEVLDFEFLNEKIRRFGYAVLEDLELLTKSMLETRDLALIGTTIDLVEQLWVGERKAASSVWLYGSTSNPFDAGLIEPPLPRVVGVDVYVGMLPAANKSADFFEVIPCGDRLILGIGDAPRLGLKSAFVARFIGNLFRTTVERFGPLRLDEVLKEIGGIISAHEYFNWVSMQCVEIDLVGGTFAVASAAHPFPVLYSARRRKCDRLPVKGEILHASVSAQSDRLLYEQRHAEIHPGDILVLITDGLLESQFLAGENYGYRFTQIVEQMSGQGATAIGKSILNDWRAHKSRHENKFRYAADDVTIMVVVKQ